MESGAPSGGWQQLAGARLFARAGTDRRPEAEDLERNLLGFHPPFPADLLSERSLRPMGGALGASGARTRDGVTVHRPRSVSSWFADRSVGLQIVTGTAVALLVAVGVGITGIASLDRTYTSAEALYQDNFMGLKQAAIMERAAVQMRLDVAEMGLSLDAGAKSKFRDQVTADEAEIRTAIETYQGLALNAEKKSALADVAAALSQFDQVRDQHMVPAAQQNDIPAFSRSRDDAQSSIDKMMNALTALVGTEQQGGEAALAKTKSTYLNDRLVAVATLATGFVLALGLGLLVSRRITRALRCVQSVVQALARGDRTTTSGLSSRDDVGRTGAALDDAIASVRTMVSKDR